MCIRRKQKSSNQTGNTPGHRLGPTLLLIPLEHENWLGRKSLAVQKRSQNLVKNREGVIGVHLFRYCPHSQHNASRTHVFRQCESVDMDGGSSAVPWHFSLQTCGAQICGETEQHYYKLNNNEPSPWVRRDATSNVVRIRMGRGAVWKSPTINR